jgi:putative tryptophan/tyrosine transport system substrate-binding protein
MAIGIGRRQFISAPGGIAVAWTLAAHAQSEKMARIGLLTRYSDASVSGQIEAFRQGLRDLGWIEGKNISIEYRNAEGQANRLPALAAELVDLNVDGIVTVDTPPTQAAKRATSTIPIVIAVSGLVSSLGHPGGNITGLSLLAPETDQKNLELLREILPKTRQVGMIFDPKNQGMNIRVNAIKTGALKLALEFQPIPALGPNELADALAVAAKDPPDALIVLSPIYAAYRTEIVEFATKTKVPLSFDTSGLAGEPGALLSYGTDISALFRRAATFVDKILKGAKPADLPVEQPEKFDLVINLKTAKALGVTIPQTLLATADKVIE